MYKYHLYNTTKTIKIAWSQNLKTNYDKHYLSIIRAGEYCNINVNELNDISLFNFSYNFLWINAYKRLDKDPIEDTQSLDKVLKFYMKERYTEMITATDQYDLYVPFFLFLD